MQVTTADLCDADAAAQVIVLPWRHYGGRQCMQGPVVTLTSSGSVGLVRDPLTQTRDGRALLVGGGVTAEGALL